MPDHPSIAEHSLVRSELYEIRVHGELGPSIVTSFPGFEAEAGAGDTFLRGPVRNQAGLHAALEQIETLGLELIAVRRLDDVGATADAG